MWMVYSRATTSSMALRPTLPWGLLDLVALGMATVLAINRLSSIGSRWRANRESSSVQQYWEGVRAEKSGSLGEGTSAPLGQARSR